MTNLSEPPRGFNPASAWWPLVREIILFGVGVSLIIVETTHLEARIPVLLVGGLLAGLPVASIFDRVLGGK